MILALSTSALGWVALFSAAVISITYAFLNVRMGRGELGSEIELAPNRKPYFDDEDLEGKRLDQVLALGMIGLFVVAIALSLYWLAEPGRQAGAREDAKRIFVARGAGMFDTTENGGFNCAFCHGGMKAEGGVVPFTITDSNGQFVKQVQWKAPALNTVFLRHDRDELRYILTYGRTFSPMPAWGEAGGGPLNTQQIQNLMDYLESIQLTPEESQAQLPDALAAEMAAADAAGKPYATEGEALFNLGYYSNFAGGAYACGRCHTTGWSYNEKGSDGNGALGPSLRDGVSLNRFPGADAGFKQQTDFVCTGTKIGGNYGANGQGTGRMPGFCVVPPEAPNVNKTGEVGVEARDPSDPLTEGGMYSKADVEKIVRYVRGL